MLRLTTLRIGFLAAGGPLDLEDLSFEIFLSGINGGVSPKLGTGDPKGAGSEGEPSLSGSELVMVIL